MPNHKTTVIVTLSALSLSALALSGCSLAPVYKVPVTPAAAISYNEIGPWTPAVPADTTEPRAWWQVFNDEGLNGLEGRLDAGNLQLASGVARFNQALALSHQAQASLLPTLNAIGSASQTFDPRNGKLNNYTLGLSAGYGLDFWGANQNSAKAAQASAQASADDLADLRLTLQAKLAETYIQLRGADAEIALLQQSVDAYQKALDLTNSRFKGGASSEIDVGRARTQLGATQAQWEQARAGRALLEHAIAVLIGVQPTGFRINTVSGVDEVPHIPMDQPSTLLQRRPDIAAAERRVNAANAAIGMARAAFFPNVILGAVEGREDYVGKQGRYWALGPVSLNLPLFNGGALSAGLSVAKAEFDQASSAYRLSVLSAFQQVEDQLALSNRLAVAADREDEALRAAVRTNQLAMVEYKDGAASYLDVVTAQTAELDARRAALNIHTSRLLASIDLIRALGGGWK